MQRQILRGLTMLMLIAAVALMAALVSAHAQSRSVVADIPFEFAVGGKSLKAGEYSVRAFTTKGDALLISNQDSNDSAIRLTHSIQARIVPQRAKLVFHRYGQRYFLSEVWTPGEGTGWQLQKSGEERAIEGQLAAISSKSELARSTYERVEIVAMVR
ncbi:MAG: hypothetical protein ACR2IB_01755 [Pyrinomonadaceae bacterium]